MAAKLLLVLAFVALSHGALVRRDAPAEPSGFETLQKTVADIGKTFLEQVQSLASSKNTEEFGKVVQDSSKSVLDDLGKLATSLQAASADATGKAKESLQTAQANIERIAKDLRDQHPEIEQQANQLKDKFQAAVQSALQETQKVAKEVQDNVAETNEKVAPKIKAGIEEFTKQVQEVGKKLHEAATKP